MTTRPRKPKPSPQALIHPDVEWQAEMLSSRVLKKVISLAEATKELEEIQTDALGETTDGSASFRPVEARSLIVTHMMNSLLKRGY